jgi:hypothetical protein
MVQQMSVRTILSKSEKKSRILTQWLWIRRDEEGNASEKYYKLFHGRENNYICQ